MARTLGLSGYRSSLAHRAHLQQVITLGVICLRQRLRVVFRRYHLRLCRLL